MTTTVVDLVNNIVTADTRWSAGHDGSIVLSDGQSYFIYCDDTGVDKIAAIGKAVLVAAGDAPLITKWKDWWYNDRSVHSRPPVADSAGRTLVSLSIVDLKDSKVIFHAGVKHWLICSKEQKIKGFTSGSGAYFAGQFMIEASCAIRSVEFASENDVCTGKDVKFVCSKSNSTNLGTPSYDYTQIVDGLFEKGYIMQVNNETNIDAVPLKEHPLHEEIKGLFKSGQAVASAPVPNLDKVKWTEETQESFEVAMERVEELVDM